MLVDLDKMYTTAQAAEKWDRAQAYICRMCQAGKIPGAIKFNNQYLIPEETYLSWRPTPSGPRPKKGRK